MHASIRRYLNSYDDYYVTFVHIIYGVATCTYRRERERESERKSLKWTTDRDPLSLYDVDINFPSIFNTLLENSSFMTKLKLVVEYDIVALPHLSLSYQIEMLRNMIMYQ